MIPSDHFVFFYNEIFKFLQKKGPEDLRKYYARVADRQAYFTLAAFRRDGLKGMYDYWERIRIEENCVMENHLEADCYWFHMARCPSLAKALESDAGPCPVYCDHCPGWVLDVVGRAGFWGVYDLVGRKTPECFGYVYAEPQLAKAKYEELLALRGGTDLVKTNLEIV